MPRAAFPVLAVSLLSLVWPASVCAQAPPAADEEQEPALPDGLAPPPPADAGEPALPSGLGPSAGADRDPALPSGLGPADPTQPEGDEGPALPAGLGPSATPAAEQATPVRDLPASWGLWGELRGGGRVVEDPQEDRLSIAELRVQLDIQKSFRAWSTSLRLVVDGVADALSPDHTPRLDIGQGAVDLRTASLTTTPTEWLDVRLGRHILTWGTGDLLFINDLFPKDWTAFLIGRDVEYLKAPSDAAKVSLFMPWFDLDVVVTPRFDADRLPRRERVSSYEPSLGRIAGQDALLAVERPRRWLRAAELAGRAHRHLGSWELSAYGYYGFWKSPAGIVPGSGLARFPRLAVYGASARGPVFGGIASFEAGYYDSLDDRRGDDPLVRNSEARGLVGYEYPLVQHVTVGAQYYVEGMLWHARHVRALPAFAPVADELRHVVTARLHVLALRERLTLSLFAFVSPSDRDAYLRPRVSYAVSDHWKATLGANLLTGRRDHTFFGQLRRNSNVYAALRWSH